MEEIKNLTDLSKIIDLCRKKGVDSIEIQGIKLSLKHEAPPSNYKKKKEPEGDVIVESLFTEEDALFWSSAGIPEEAANA